MSEPDSPYPIEVSYDEVAAEAKAVFGELMWELIQERAQRRKLTAVIEALVEERLADLRARSDEQPHSD